MGLNGSSSKQDEIGSKSKSIASNSEQNVAHISTGSCDRQLLKRCQHIPFDVEAWYEILQCETFYTEFIPISPSIAQAFVNFYQTRYNSKNLLTSNDLQLIESVEQQLNQQIRNSKNNRFQINGTFIRLSSRSPKDGNPLDSKTMIQLYHQELKTLQTKYPDEYNSVEGKANMRMIAYCYAQSHSLKVNTEFEALNLILSSERVFIDLLEALNCQKVRDHPGTNINNIQLYDWDVISKDDRHKATIFLSF